MDKKGKLSILYLGSLALSAVFFPMLTGMDPNVFDPNTVAIPSGPSLGHLFGTDDLGRDILARAVYGARISLTVGVVAVGISTTFGLIVGLFSGYLGGIVDEIIMRTVDMLMAIPTIFLILTIQVILEPSIYNVMVVIGITSWMGVARLVRAEVLSIKERLFVTSAKSRGVYSFRLLVKYILPHALNPIIVAATIGVGSAILTESVLSFLGLGVQPPHASWGNMLQNSLSFMYEAPWMAIFPGILITLTVLAFNFLGDTLREMCNPRDTHA
ncbi:MAG: ABC transporter permease [Candidatus Margulisbacteria bacterium]|nr:ABC transporter permease [Candidatus Margulisiibacteriota bacterium]